MEGFSPVGKFLIAVGLLMILTGIIIIFIPKIPYIGKLPGDIYIKKGNFSFYMPVTTSIIISILVTVIINLIKK